MSTVMKPLMRFVGTVLIGAGFITLTYDQLFPPHVVQPVIMDIPGNVPLLCVVAIVVGAALIAYSFSPDTDGKHKEHDIIGYGL